MTPTERFVLFMKSARANGDATPLNPMFSREIADRLGYDKMTLRSKNRMVRDWAHEAAISGQPVSSTSKGYFWATSASELEHAIADKYSRINEIRRHAAGLERAKSNLLQPALIP